MVKGSVDQFPKLTSQSDFLYVYGVALVYVEHVVPTILHLHVHAAGGLIESIQYSMLP